MTFQLTNRSKLSFFFIWKNAGQNIPCENLVKYYYYYYFINKWKWMLYKDGWCGQFRLNAWVHWAVAWGPPQAYAKLCILCIACF